MKKRGIIVRKLMRSILTSQRENQYPDIEPHMLIKFIKFIAIGLNSGMIKKADLSRTGAFINADSIMPNQSYIDSWGDVVLGIGDEHEDVLGFNLELSAPIKDSFACNK